MKASETSLRELLQGGKQFQIPLFQRPYCWGIENWKTLWDDIISLYNDEDSVESYYFLGSAVTLAVPGTPAGISPFVVIDGQQRLTTLTLLLAALRDYLKAQGFEQAAEELHELYLINKFKQGDDFYKVLPTQADRKAYQQIIHRKEIKESSRIYQAYNFFREQIEKGNSSVEISIDLTKLKTVVLERLSLVCITLDDKDNPYLIFESLNYKGEPLTQADLVRNYFFMRLPREQHEAVYEEIWLPLQERFRINAGDTYLDELTNAFWYYLGKDGQLVNYNQVYQALKLNLEKPCVNVLDALKDLSCFAEYYLRLRFPKEEPELKLRKWFHSFGRLDFTTCYPFLLKLYGEYTSKRLSIEAFEQTLSYLESYLVRRLFAGVPTQGLNKAFNTLCRQLDLNDIVGSLRHTLISFQRSQIWPDDDWFRRSIIEQPVYGGRRIDRVKLLLESLGEILTKEQVNPENLTVEHIMPQTLTAEWKTMLGSKAEEVHKRWLHTLGNLTLTAYNSELSNKHFSEKLSYLQHSCLALNRYFQKLETWDEQAIQNRGEYLADIALRVWSR